MVRDALTSEAIPQLQLQLQPQPHHVSAPRHRQRDRDRRRGRRLAGACAREMHWQHSARRRA
eukprot:1744930-Rhodomonas_salina.1